MINESLIAVRSFFPNVDDIILEYTIHYKDGVWREDRLQKRSLMKGQLDVDFNNDRKTFRIRIGCPKFHSPTTGENGYFVIENAQDIIRIMLRDGQREQYIVKMCNGYKSSPKGRKRYYCESEIQGRMIIEVKQVAATISNKNVK